MRHGDPPVKGPIENDFHGPSVPQPEVKDPHDLLVPPVYPRHTSCNSTFTISAMFPCPQNTTCQVNYNTAFSSRSITFPETLHFIVGSSLPFEESILFPFSDHKVPLEDNSFWWPAGMAGGERWLGAEAVRFMGYEVAL